MSLIDGAIVESMRFRSPSSPESAMANRRLIEATNDSMVRSYDTLAFNRMDRLD